MSEPLKLEWACDVPWVEIMYETAASRELVQNCDRLPDLDRKRPKARHPQCAVDSSLRFSR